MGKNKFGDTFFHIAIRHGQLGFVRQVVQYIEKNIEVLFDDKTARRFPFDTENLQEKCTPYTLALLREQFEMAHELVRYGRSDKYYKNKEMENAFDIARRLNIKSVQRYLI